MDEIFGASNFTAQITLLCNPKGRSQDKYFATCHEYLLVYTKSAVPAGWFSVEKDDAKIEKDYKLSDAGGKYRLLELRNTHREFGKENRPNLWYPIYANADDGTVSLEKMNSTTLKYTRLGPMGMRAAGHGVLNWHQKAHNCLLHKRKPVRGKSIANLTLQQMAKPSGKSCSLSGIIRNFYRKGQVAFGQIFPEQIKMIFRNLNQLSM